MAADGLTRTPSTNITVIGGLPSAGPAVLNDKTSASNVAIRAITHRWVDYVNGSDANDGLSAGSPLKTLAAAIALGSNQHITLATGSHQLAGSVTLTDLAGVTIVGNGLSTQLIVNGDYDAFALTGACSSIHMRGFLITSFLARASGAGINVTAAGTASYNLRFEHIQIQNTHDGVILSNVSTSRFIDIAVVQTTAGRMAGNGISLTKTVSCRFVNCSVTSTSGKIGGYGFLADSDCDTTLVAGGEFGNCTLDNVALRNTAGVGHTGPRLFRMTDAWNEGSLANGVGVYSGRDVKLSGMELVGNALDGLLVAGGSAIRIESPFISQSGHHGINVSGSGGDDTLDTVNISNPDCTNNSQTTSVTYDGISLTANTPITVTGGRSGDHTFTLANKQRYGVDIGSTTDYVQVTGINLSGNTTGQLRNTSTGLNNNIQGQRGWQQPYTWQGPDLAAYTGIAANEAMYYRVKGSARAISKIGLWIGVQSGNISVAVLRGKPGTNPPTTRIATTGAVACPAPGYNELTLDTAVDVDEETCWFAISSDNTTATFGRVPAPGGADTAGANGFCYRGSTQHPIPSSPTSLNGSIKVGIILIGRQ